MMRVGVSSPATVALTWFFAAVLGPAFVMASGCASDDGVAECEELGEKCHDVETDAAQACHELGHAGDGEACLARYDACLEVCAP